MADGTLQLIFIQVASRALTFLGNQLLLGFITPEIFGVAVQLEALTVSILYFSRESLRVALQRQPSLKGKAQTVQSQIYVNLGYLIILLGTILTFVLTTIYKQRASQDVLSSPDFNTSLNFYRLAIIIELLSEPGFLIIQQRQRYSSRAATETSAAILKCITAVGTSYLASRQKEKFPPSVLPFAVGQLAYAGTLLNGFVFSSPDIREDYSFAPVVVKGSPGILYDRFDSRLLTLASTLYGQSVFKQLLNQGETLILSFTSTLSEQGAFALATNYGGLMARLIFQPIEEASRNTFGRLLSGTNSPSRISKPAENSRSKSEFEPQRSLRQVITQLNTTLHFYSILSILSCSILSHILPLLVRLTAGPVWVTPSVTALLSAYAYYIPFMAYNGILDAFVTSVATPGQLRQQSVWTGAFAAIYVATVWALMKGLGWGAVGLVYANMFNMATTIVWSVGFVGSYLDEQQNGEGNLQGLGLELVPNLFTAAIGVSTSAVLRNVKPDAIVVNVDGLRQALPMITTCAVGGISM